MKKNKNIIADKNDIIEITIEPTWQSVKEYNVLDLFGDGYFFKSKSEARRAIEQGAKIKIRYIMPDKNILDVDIKSVKDVVCLFYGIDAYLIGSGKYKSKKLEDITLEEAMVSK
jgi:hypothetical protein